MQRIRILLALILSLTLSVALRAGLFTVSTASAAPQADLTNNQPVIQFPNTITFRANLTANANITAVFLEYGTEQQTCGNDNLCGGRCTAPIYASRAVILPPRHETSDRNEKRGE